MSVLKYGWVRGGRQGTEMPVDASITFGRKGAAFVCASTTTPGSGLMMLIDAVTDVCVGWAEVPRAAVPGTADYWTSSSTVGKDKVFVIHDPTAVFGCPVAEAGASLSASLVGRYVNATWSGSGTSKLQKIDCVATKIAANQMFFCVGVEITDTDRIAYVRINPSVAVA